MVGLRARVASVAEKLLARVSGGKFVRNVAVLAGGGAIAQVIPVALTPVLTRLYSPADMGILALYISFIGFATAGITLGYSMAIVSAHSDREAAELVVISAISAVPMAILGGLILLLLSVKGWLGFGQLPYLVSAAMTISLLLSGMYATMRFWLIRSDQYRVISAATITQSIVRVGIQVMLGIAGFGGPGLIGGEVVGRGAGLRQMWRESTRRLRESIRSTKWWQLRTTGIKYRKFPLFSAPSSLLNSLAIALPIPLISSVFDVDAAGQFSVASRVLLLPLALIGASIGDVFHSRISRLSMESPASAMPLLLRTSGGLFFLGIVPMLIVALYGDRLWPAVLGEEWRISGQIAAVITPWALMQLAVNPVSRVVAVYKGQEFKLIFDVLGLSCVIGVMTTAARLNWTLIDTCSVLGGTQAVIYGVYLLLLIQIVRKNTYVNAGTGPGESATS